MGKENGKRLIDGFFSSVSEHPYLYIALFCVMLLPFGFSQAEQVTTVGVIIEAVIWCFALAVLFLHLKPSANRTVNVYLMVSSTLIITLYSIFVVKDTNISKMMFIPALVIIAQFAVVMAKEKTLTTERIVPLLIALGIVVRYCYVLTITSTMIQHDVGSFTGTSGHAPYIMYWYNNGFALPDFNITTRWQFYHPPLHHMLMAFLLKIFTTIGLPLELSQQAIQILPMFYSSVCMVVCYRIFKMVKLSGAGLVTATALSCFFPTFIIWGGEYNNDMLVTLFMLSAVLCTLKWYNKPSLARIVPIALCVGLGMMTKLSAWMVAPAIAIVFLYVFIKNIKKPLPFIGQYAVFGVICVPLGLWWGVRNLIKFNVPITYVPDPSMDVMSVAKVPLAQRLFDLSFYQFAYPYDAFTMYKAPYNEFNPAVGLIKTSLLDEKILPSGWDVLATIVLILTTLITIVCMIYFIVMLFKKSNPMDVVTKVFFAVIVLTVLVSYYIFCFKYPYVCTENIRYCMPVIPILAMSFGFMFNGFIRKPKKKA